MNMIFSKILNYIYIALGFIKFSLRKLLTDRLSVILVIITLVINILAWVGSYFLNSIIDTNLAVLHYNVVFGIDLIGDANQLYLTPLIGAVVLIINIFLGALLKDSRDKLLSVMLLSVALLVNIACLIALYFSYIINFS